MVLRDQDGTDTWRGVLLVLLGLAVVLGVSWAWKGSSATLISESGGVEWATLIVLGLAGMLLARHLADEGLLRRRWYLLAAIALLALRELDFHDWFHGLVHIRTHTRPAPLGHKLATGGVTVLILLVFVRLVWFGARPFARALWRRAGWAWSLAVGIGLAALSTTLDGAERKLTPYGIVLDPAIYFALGGLEEAMELVFALSLLWAVRLYSGKRLPR